MESTRNMRIASRSILFAIVLCILVLLLPIWPYSSSWNYYPSFAVVLALTILASVFFRVLPRRL